MPSRFDIDDAAEHGEVFTRRWVVELILDLVGYTPDRPLHELTVVEPACGSGAFLGPIAERVSASCRAHDVDLLAAQSAVRAFDVLPRNVHAAKRTVQAILRTHGWPENQVMAITDAWITRSDFLLDDLELDAADFVVGNPPYIRLEDMPSDRTAAYRQAWPTMAGRADIYIGSSNEACRSWDLMVLWVTSARTGGCETNTDRLSESWLPLGSVSMPSSQCTMWMPSILQSPHIRRSP